MKLTMKELAQIQKAAFLPLYEKFHDEGNPCLRGAEDILKRLNKNNRYFTILVDGKIIGGVFYRCVGTRPPYINIGEGEYYLCRIYIHPDYQSKGIASKVILLCENEFADAKVYHIDFPSVMAKNRRCYEKAGFEDTGITMTIPNAPELAIYKKIVKDEFDISGVTLPFIYEVSKEELLYFLGPPLSEVFPKYFKEDFETLFNEYRDYNFKIHGEFAKPIDGALDILKYLKKEGYKNALYVSF